MTTEARVSPETREFCLLVGEAMVHLLSLDDDHALAAFAPMHDVTELRFDREDDGVTVTILNGEDKAGFSIYMKTSDFAEQPTEEPDEGPGYEPGIPQPGTITTTENLKG